MTTQTAFGDAPPRFRQKRQLILAAATDLMNEYGVKGMTFTKVAEAIELNTTSVTYYFRRKDLLAEAILLDALERYEAMARAAAQEPTPAARLARLVDGSLRSLAAIRSGEEPPIANLAHISALDDPIRGRLSARYVEVFRIVREFLSDDPASDKKLQTARAQVLLENLFWGQAWLQRYSLGDFERVAGRLSEVLAHGIAPRGADWDPRSLDVPRPDVLAGNEAMNDAFLRSATSIMNERGYRGASVERIAGELKVTKGSFYHHLDSKDDLVLACFGRSYGRVSLAQRAAQKAGGTHYGQLSSAVAALLHDQLYGEAPLLRTTALSALPPELRQKVVARSNRMARRFAGMLIDGITEGSVRAIDPLIAAQTVMAALNCAYELRRWAADMREDEAIALYASIITRGMID